MMRKGDFWARYGVTIDQDKYDDLFKRVKSALLSGNRPLAQQLADSLVNEPYPLSFLYLAVIIPVLSEITDEWVNGPRSFS